MRYNGKKEDAMKLFCIVFALIVICAVSVCLAMAEDAVIHDGSKVAFHYSLVVDGNVADSSQGREPLTYTQGEGKLIPGLTKQLLGMKVGEEKTVEVKPQDAYGMPNPAGIKEIPMSAVPKDLKPAVGMILQMQDEKGQVFPAKVTEVKKDSIIIDLNHPLAGKTLIFKVKIVAIQ